MWCRVVLLGGIEGRYPMAERSPSISAICFVGGAGRARTDDDRIMSPLAPTRALSHPKPNLKMAGACQLRPTWDESFGPGVKQRLWARATQATSIRLRIPRHRL